MRVAELPFPVRAAKADWLPGTTWLGFTPDDGSPKAFVERQTTVAKQFGDGYVLEYVTLKFDDPNPEFEDDPRIETERKRHEAVAGRLLAIHRLRSTAKSLRAIVGDKEFSQVQDMWAKAGARHRWSVAFPIVETYHVVGKPLAKDVFDKESYRHLFGYSTGILRPLNDRDRSFILNMELERGEALNAWIDTDIDLEMARRSAIPNNVFELIDRDLRFSAVEGLTKSQQSDMRLRNAYLANKFIIQRTKENKLMCDNCKFDPVNLVGQTGVRPRSLLDVHHKNPLENGPRTSTLADFALLCPTCHRMEHSVLRLATKSLRPIAEPN